MGIPDSSKDPSHSAGNDLGLEHLLQVLKEKQTTKSETHQTNMGLYDVSWQKSRSHSLHLERHLSLKTNVTITGDGFETSLNDIR